MQEFLRHRFGFVATANAVLLRHRATDPRSVRSRFGLAANIGAVAHDDGTLGEIPANAQRRSKLRRVRCEIGRGADGDVLIAALQGDDVNCPKADRHN
jgi:hypothetical protein